MVQPTNPYTGKYEESNMRKMSFLSLIAAAILLFTSCSDSALKSMTTMELVRDMGLGINLGNTFEAGGSWVSPQTVTAMETCWGSPIVTEELIKGYKEGGFGVVRVPANWSNTMLDDYTLNPEYVSRLQQVVGWVVDNGMYAILNMHHEGWISGMPTDEEEVLKRYTRFWEQICEAFKKYNGHLMFESMNEEAGFDSVWNKWEGDDGKEEAYYYVNKLNQTFVDVVRNSGGNNPKRHLLIAGYYTAIDSTCDPLYLMPEDPENRCAVSVHYYNPSTLTLIDKDVSWGKAKTTWGSDEDIEDMNKWLDMMTERFVSNGIPVIIGEYGCFGDNKTEEVRRNYTVDVTKAIYEKNMCPVLWDTPGGFYNRETFKFDDEEKLRKMMDNLSE